MFPCPVGTPDPEVIVEYDSHKGERRTKLFWVLSAAKAFWMAQYKAGRNPKYINPRKVVQK